ncbi:MAG: hypothetical protein CML66_17075 [Rhodobacteraceae bacterium]|nr:hypothetical protein [Paracoccaceae bacterium]QEW18651.1 Cyclolysin [Marinibacterium anthonyi]
MTTYTIPYTHIYHEDYSGSWNYGYPEDTYTPGYDKYSVEQDSVNIFIGDNGTDTFTIHNGLPRSPEVKWASLFAFDDVSFYHADYETDYGVYQLTWSGGTTYLLGTSVDYISGEPSFNTGYDYRYDEYWLTLGGDTLPTFDDLPEEDAYAAYVALFDSGTLTTLDWPFGEGLTFDLGEIPGVEITENDVITGTAEGDELYAGLGNDVFLMGDGIQAHHLDGGVGRDTVSYYSNYTSSHPSVLRVSLANNERNSGAARGDTYTSIENVTGTNHTDVLVGDEFANTLRGKDGDDSLRGLGGDDRLQGGDGADVLEGGAGADLLEGGDGLDLASYTRSSIGIYVDLQSPGLSTGEAAGDTFVDIEGIDGSSYDDMLRGDAFDNRLIGEDGNDQIRGRAGNDTLFGQHGDDTLFGDAGDDTLYGGAGNDAFYFNGGVDMIMDFDAAHDTAYISDTFAAGDSLTASDLQNAAAVVDGTLYLYFGSNVLGFEGYSSLDQVSDAIMGY